jgi:DMSO/TMAO reductase YedYZ molybdopterin-dependent catalytic subunit
MKKSAKIVIAIFVLLIVAAVPLHFYTRPDISQVGALKITGKVNTLTTLTLEQLKTYPAVTLQVTLTSSGTPSGNGVFNYTGVAVADLLNQTHASTNSTSIYIQAQDGYGTTITSQEAQKPNTIIAYQKDGAPLTALKDGGEGPLRLIIGSDQYAQRWIRGVVAIEVS